MLRRSFLLTVHGNEIHSDITQSLSCKFDILLNNEIKKFNARGDAPTTRIYYVIFALKVLIMTYS